MRRWLKAGVLEDGVSEPSEAGGPHGGSGRVVLSHLDLHSVRDRWGDRLVKPRLHGEAYLVRDLDDVGVCVQHRADAERCPRVLVKRRANCAFTLEPNNTRLVACGRLAERQARGPGKRPETCALLGLTHDCTRNPQGYFTVGWKTAQTRLRRRLANFQQRRQRIRHQPLTAQVVQRTQALRGH